MERRRLENKIAMVTGAAKGIGLAISRRLVDEGATLVLVDINSAGMEKAQSDFLRQNPSYKGLWVKANVAKKDEVEAAVSKAVDAFGRVDILAHCAGILSNYRFIELPEDQWDSVLNVNLKGTFLVLQRVAREMMKQKKGKICCIASTAAKHGIKYIAHYVASKFGIVGLVQTAAMEFAQHGINVNCICPGEVDTDMLRNSYKRICEIEGISMEEQIERGKNLPLIHRLSPPESVAPLVAFLVSDESNEITGQAINVDGGIAFN